MHNAAAKADAHIYVKLESQIEPKGQGNFTTLKDWDKHQEDYQDGLRDQANNYYDELSEEEIEYNMMN